MKISASELKRAVMALGWPGWLGVSALLLAAALLLASQGWGQQTLQLQADADGLSRQIRSQRAAGGPSGPAAPPATAQQWQQALPSAEARQQRLADLLEIGLNMGLASARTLRFSSHR